MSASHKVTQSKLVLKKVLKPESLKKMSITKLGNYWTLNPLRSWYARRRLYHILEFTDLCLERNRAIDFGCGAGYFLPSLSLIFSIACGLELKSEWNERLKTNLDEHFSKNGYPNVSYQLVEVGSEFSAFEEESIDFISAADILEHFTSEQLANFMSESCRVLKKGGILAVSLPSENWIYHIFSSKDSGHVANSSRAINSLVNRLGETFELINYRFIFPFFKVVCYKKAKGANE